MKLLPLLFLAAVVGSAQPTRAAEVHVVDTTSFLSGESTREIEGRLSRFEQESGIRVLMRFHQQEPSGKEDSAPGVYMRALSAKLGVLENGVLLVHFADVNEWRVWIGNELTARFVGLPGTAEGFTESGAMHNAKEAWLKNVFTESQGVWNWWQHNSPGEPLPSEKVEFEAIALSDGIEAKFATEFSSLGEELLDAVISRDSLSIRSLLSRSVNLESRDEKGRTPLMIATHANHVELAEELIKSGADVNARDNLQDTPFLFAGAQGRTEILKHTLEYGADLKSVNRFKGTALIPAAEKGHLENVRMLLATDIDIDHVNRPGWTALYEAVMRPRYGSEIYRGIVQALLDAGVDETIPDKQGRTPEQRAREVDNINLAEMIAEYAATKKNHE